MTSRRLATLALGLGAAVTAAWGGEQEGTVKREDKKWVRRLETAS